MIVSFVIDIDRISVRSTVESVSRVITAIPRDLPKVAIQGREGESIHSEQARVHARLIIDKNRLQLATGVEREDLTIVGDPEEQIGVLSTRDICWSSGQASKLNWLAVVACHEINRRGSHVRGEIVAAKEVRSREEKTSTKPEGIDLIETASVGHRVHFVADKVDSRHASARSTTFDKY